MKCIGHTFFILLDGVCNTVFELRVCNFGHASFTRPKTVSTVPIHPVLGRFNAMDPMVDKYADWTPYNFAFNDPANKNDPGGDDPYVTGPRPIGPSPVPFDPKGVSAYGTYETKPIIQDPNVDAARALAAEAAGWDGFSQMVAFAQHSEKARQQEDTKARDEIQKLINTALGADGDSSFTFGSDSKGSYYWLDFGGNNSRGEVEVHSQKVYINANQGGQQPYPRGSIGGPVPYYGNFLGPGPDGNPYQLIGYNRQRLKPIDMLDAAAQRHDYAYFLAQTGGVQGALFARRVSAADAQLSIDAWGVVGNYYNNINDTITGKPITDNELSWSEKVIGAFQGIAGYKILLGGHTK